VCCQSMTAEMEILPSLRASRERKMLLACESRSIIVGLSSLSSAGTKNFAIADHWSSNRRCAADCWRWLGVSKGVTFFLGLVNCSIYLRSLAVRPFKYSSTLGPIEGWLESYEQRKCRTHKDLDQRHLNWCISRLGGAPARLVPQQNDRS
jgi:hypothetical protein